MGGQGMRLSMGAEARVLSVTGTFHFRCVLGILYSQPGLLSQEAPTTGTLGGRIGGGWGGRAGEAWCPSEKLRSGHGPQPWGTTLEREFASE